MIHYIKVVAEDGDEPLELPTEEDGTILLTTLSAQFPGSCGLKYRNPDSGTMRGIRLSDGRLYPPDNDWGKQVFVSVFPKGMFSLQLLFLVLCPCYDNRMFGHFSSRMDAPPNEKSHYGPRAVKCANLCIFNSADEPSYVYTAAIGHLKCHETDYLDVLCVANPKV